MKKQFIIMMASVLMIVYSGQVRAVTEYTITDLGTLGGSSSRAHSVNDSGQVVGYSYITGNSARHAFLYDGTTMHDLGTLGGSSSWAEGINDSGQIVGYSYLTGDEDFHAFLYDGTIMHDLGTLGGSASYAYGINNSGQVVGRSGATGGGRAFLYDGIAMQNLGTLGGSYSEAYGINNNGQVVGNSHITGSSDSHIFLYDGTTMHDLGTLGGSSSWAEGINDSGQVVGNGRITGSSTRHAFLYDGTIMHDLGALGGSASYAFGINNSSQVVGYYRTGTIGSAFLYDGGNMIDLNTLLLTGSGWVLIQALDINNSGQIVGYGSNNGEAHAFLMTPVSELTPPIADADGPYTIHVDDILTLDGSGSTDDDNDIVSYMWDLDDNNSFETDAGSEPIFDVNYTYLQSLGLLVNNTYNIYLKVTDSEGQSDVNDSTLAIIPQPALRVAVDIKPGSCPNPLNVKSSGVLPVAILGTADVNVIDIVPTSIAFSIGEVSVGAIRNAYEDVAAPVTDTNDCNCIEAGPDGFLDLTLKFYTQDIVEAIGDVNDGDILPLTLMGVLFGERPIEGTDCVVIRGKHKPFNKADINKDGVVDIRDFAIFAENWLQSSIVEE